MDAKKIRAIGAAVVAALWLVLISGAWFGPVQDISVAERRPLAQMPKVTAQSILSAKFMGEFEDFTLDQFPLRDTFRQLKALFHYNALQQGDNNDIYMAQGFAAKMEYPLNEDSVNYAIGRFNRLYELYLKDSGSVVFQTVVPDKSYYLAEENGYLAMDYQKLFSMMQAGLPWAQYVDITDCLSIQSYYYTDTHWRQEHLFPAAQKLSQALGVTQPEAGDFTQTPVEKPFYGVYYGQAALPMEAETMYTMNSFLLDACIVTNHETGKKVQVYDLEKLTSRDLYDIFLSGTTGLITIENPNADTDRELIIFRDSFGSSLAPLLVQDYRTVTLVDIRSIAPEFLGNFVDFHGQDVLFVYSSLVLNASETLK